MACFHEVVEVYADMSDGEEDREDVERKHWFADCEMVVFQSQQGVIDTERLVSGFRPLFSSVDMNGTDDKRTPVDGGKPVVGNFLNAESFDFKFMCYTGVFSIAPTTFANSISNSFTFRMIWMLVWLYPPSSTDQDDEEEFFLNFFQTYSGSSLLHAFLQPEKKHQVKILYDCIHTVSSPKAPLRNQVGSVSSAAGGQAGYVVLPFAAGAQPGWVVPAASVPATSTTVVTELRDVYGGHQFEIVGNVDLKGLGMSLWRDPFEEEVQQMVPYLQCFICTDPRWAYRNVEGAERDWSLNVSGQTRFTFTDM